MRACLLLITSATLGFGPAALAEPAKAPVQKAEQPADRPVEIVIASADQARPSASIDQHDPAAAPVKRRAARVTTCRCGGQTPTDN